MGSESIPKPLRTVDGVPLIERLLRQFVAAGIRDVTVITGWLGTAIEDHIGCMAGLPGDLEVSFLRETEPRGNAGAFGSLPRTVPVLFAFADLFTALDFGELYRVHRSRSAAVTLASHYERVRVRLGELVAEGDEVRGYREKPVKEFLICSGIGVVEPHVLPLADRGAPTGLSDFVTGVLEAGHPVTHWVHGAPWVDANTPSDLAEASAAAHAAS